MDSRCSPCAVSSPPRQRPGSRVWGLTLALMTACGGEGALDRDAVPAAPGPTPDGSLYGAGATAWEPDALESGTPAARYGQLAVADGHLVDSTGNPVQLKGVSTMWLNWERNFASSKDGLRWLRDNWGLSVVRAAMGIEPPGAYLENRNTLINNVRTVVRNAIDLGVYVIIDWHDHTGQEHQEEATEFFTLMAAEFGEYPNVLYETYNEPTRVSWSEVLKPYHTQVVDAIRQSDPDNIAILGTPFWSQAVNDAALDPVEGANLMYTVHFYSCTHGPQQRQQAVVAADAGLAIFVTEWGATEANGGTDVMSPVCDAEARLWHDFMDERQISWTAWKLDGCPDLSCFFQAQAPRNGGWTDEMLNGHGPFVREMMTR